MAVFVQSSSVEVWYSVLMTVLLVLVAIGLAELPAQEDPLRAASARYTVEVLSRGGDDRSARVMISNRQTSRRHILSVNSTLGELRRVLIREDEERVLLLCEKGFVVVDPDGQVPADEVYAREPLAAPGGRWIVYQRHYPATHPGTTEGIALYDTQRSKEENHAAYPVPEEREWRAGWPIYPRSNEWTSAGLVTARDEAFLLSSPLRWMGTPHEPLLVFTIRKGDTDTLVLATPLTSAGGPSGTDPARVCAEPLPGSADRWATKTIEVKAGSNGLPEVRVESGALDDDRPIASFTFGPGCRTP